MNDLTNISNACCSDGCDEHCVFSNEPNQNGIDDPSPRRHSSMDQLMGLLHEMGKSRQRSLSDGQDEGLSIYIRIIVMKVLNKLLLFRKRKST